MKSLKARMNEVQRQPVTKVLKALKTDGRALLQMATGTGKTNVAVKVYQEIIRKEPKARVLWLTHLAELAEQTYERFVTVTGLTPSVDIGLFSSALKDRNSRLIVATVQSISKKYNLESFDSKDFDYIFVDEAHHIAANTWSKVLNYFPKAKRFGFTATPNRPDDVEGKVAATEAFGEPVFELSYKEAVKKKLISKADGWKILTDSVLDPKFDSKGDFARSSLDRVWSTEGRMEIIIAAYKKYGRSNMKKMGLPFKTVCYCINTNHAEEMVKRFNAAGIKSSILVGSSKVLTSLERAKTYADFAYSDKVEVICVVNIFNEGVDLPGIGCLLMARPTKSNIIYWQQLGRGVRRIDGQKDKVIVLDFVDNAEKKFLGYTSANIESKGVSPRRIVTEYLKIQDKVRIEQRILDLTASVEEFENQFRRPNGWWTKERLKKEALKYKTPREWETKSNSSYSAARKAGILKDCTAHMTRIIRDPKNKKDEIKKFFAAYKRFPSYSIQKEKKLNWALRAYTNPASGSYDNEFDMWARKNRYGKWLSPLRRKKL